MNLAEQLTQWNACFLGRLWVTHERTTDAQLLWARCPRAEWMIWYLVKYVRAPLALGGPEHRLVLRVVAFIVHQAMTLPPPGVDNSFWQAHSQTLLGLMRWTWTSQEHPCSCTASVVATPRANDRDVLLSSALQKLLGALVSPWEAVDATEHAMFAMTVGMAREERKKEQRDLADLVRSFVPVCPLLDSSTSPGFF